MPDAETPAHDASPESSPDSPPRAPTRRPSVFADPLVRRMAYASIGLVILFLATVAGALVTGLLAPSGPRTLAEKELAVSGEAVRQGSTAPGDWGRYVAALVDAGQYGRARSVLQDARGSIDDSGTAEIPLGEARLAAAQGQHESAVEHAEEAMEVLDADLEVRLASGGLIADRARISGQHNNYWVAALIAAYSYGELESWEEAVEKFDLYIDRNPGAADVLVDRGHAKAELGDTAGAEADFRAALRFIPDSEEALEGLEQIGVTP